jgi:transposase
MREHTSMKKIREVLRLTYELGLNQRQVAESVCISRTSVQEIQARCKVAKLQWPLGEEDTDEKLSEILFPKTYEKDPEKKIIPDWSNVHKELKMKGVTKQLLWIEYKEENQQGYQYTQFCGKYREWEKLHRLSMRQNHIAGEKMFLDFSGLTVPYVNHQTGEIKKAEIFLAVLGGSSYTFSYAVENQTIPNWIHAHTKAFDYFGGSSLILVPDNLKSAIQKTCRYEPDLNPTYREFAKHYGVAVIPARPYKPKDKSKVEVGVQVAQRWILAKLRKRTFYSILEINDAIQPLLEELNDKKMRHLGSSRKELFEQYEKKELKNLPSEHFEIYEWKNAKINIDYHVQFETNYYSAHHGLVHKDVELRITKNVIEIYHSNKLVALHKRSFQIGKYSTLKGHMPMPHQKHVEWTPERILNWASGIGVNTTKCFGIIIARYPHPEQGFRSCLGILRLAKQYSEYRLEAACTRAVVSSQVSFKSIKNILKTSLDKVKIKEEPMENISINHENIRGSDYYV